MKYICIEDLELPMYDENMKQIDSLYTTIKEGSIWGMELVRNYFRLKTDKNILDSLIDLKPETFNKYFIKEEG